MTTEQIQQGATREASDAARPEAIGKGKLWQRLFRTRDREALERSRRRLAEHEKIIDDKKEAFLRCPKCGETLEKIS